MKIVWRTALVCLLAGPLAAGPFIILQSTTSTENTGLFDHILPRFEAETGIDVRVVAVGTGQALKNAARGDGDVVLVHARSAEEAFVAAGHGRARYDVMFNDFVIVGPPEDPAGIRGLSDAVRALDQIARTRARFTSRGDDSGTHKAERALWADTNVDLGAASGTWYLETGAGMGATLNIATATGAYVLTDRATWISFGNKGRQEILVAGDPRLLNQYGVIPVSHPSAKDDLADIFVDWILSEAGQAAIAGFTQNGVQLFFPNAEK
ncbi:MAG: substrate-binding domain-containing protein [Pseudomonadota bacterium]